MSSENITIVWQVDRTFNLDPLESLMEKYSSNKLEPKNEYQLQLWKTNSLTVILYEKSLVVQGKKDDRNIDVIIEMNEIEGLTLDSKNRDRLLNLLPRYQSALLCSSCGKPLYLVDSKIEGLDIIFHNECGHINNLRPPFTMCVNRILPDLNILISKHFSRLINLGFFKGSEILIPNYLLSCVDHYIGKKSTKAVSDELENLRALEKLNEISILLYEDNIKIPLNRDEYDKTEDESLLQIATITNSILLTADSNLKDRTILHNRPVIFLNSEALKKIKILEEIRTP